VKARAQVLVIGGGPAGSTSATLLGLQGFEVTLLEREVFPRYHIGESLVPSILPILKLSGAREKVEAHGFRRKDGAYFEWGAEQWDLCFGDLPGGSNYSWQVIRSEFDDVLLGHAASQGVAVHQGIEVTRLHFEGDRPRRATWVRKDGGAGGDIDFDFLIDASGRAGLMATRYLRGRRFNESFQNVGVWGYWEGTRPLDRGPAGAIAVCSLPQGWFWGIPLHDGTLSVGLVTSKVHLRHRRAAGDSLEEIYAAAIAECPRIASLVGPGRLVSGIRAETDYSYTTERFGGPGYLICGDAACFLDPLLSTGVHLATFSALLGAATAASVLRDEVPEEHALRFYGTSYRRAYERIMVLVSTFYDAYRGKDAHFYAAQKLTRAERAGLRLHDAFLNIVSGVEDLRDAQDEALSRVIDHLGGPDVSSLELFRRYHEVAGPIGISSETAVEGLYVVTQPRLRLCSTAVPAPAGAPGSP
jgi:flavin-dependent dehydrogenase